MGALDKIKDTLVKVKDAVKETMEISGKSMSKMDKPILDTIEYPKDKIEDLVEGGEKKPKAEKPKKEKPKPKPKPEPEAEPEPEPAEEEPEPEPAKPKKAKKAKKGKKKKK